MWGSIFESNEDKMWGAIFELNKDKKSGRLIDEEGNIRFFENHNIKGEIKPFEEIYFKLKDNETENKIQNTIPVIKKTKVDGIFKTLIRNDLIRYERSASLLGFIMKNKKTTFLDCSILLFLVGMVFGTFFMFMDGLDLGLWWWIIDVITYLFCGILFQTISDDALTHAQWHTASNVVFFLFVVVPYLYVSYRLGIWRLKEQYEDMKDCLFQVDIIEALSPTDIKIKDEFYNRFYRM